MVDLQRSMACIWNIVRAGMQDGPGNSDGEPSQESLSGEKFSFPDSPENIIRADLIRLEPVQYTSCWTLPFFFKSATNSTASSVDRAPNWATISTSARSTSFAIRLASPQT